MKEPAMNAPTANQHYHLILADIAMAAAIRTHDSGYALAADERTYRPGTIRDAWLETTADDALRQRVTAMATAAVGSLAGMAGEQIAQAAAAYGVPLEAGVAGRMAEHFTGKRDAVLTYRR